jgi:hypothetical protein
MLPPIVKTSAEALAANINRFISFLPRSPAPHLAAAIRFRHITPA